MRKLIKRGERLCAVCGTIGKPKIKTRTKHGDAKFDLGLSIATGGFMTRGAKPVTSQVRTAYCRTCGAGSPG